MTDATSLKSPMPVLKAIGPYRILGVLGEGGMEIVCTACGLIRGVLVLMPPLPPETSMQTQKDQEAKVSLQKQADQQAQTAQQQFAILQAQIDAVAPDTDRVRIDFSFQNNVVSIGLFDARPNGKPAWAVRRNPNSLITWKVAPNVTINSIEAKPGSDPLPIDVDPNEHGGQPGVPFKAKVKSDAGDPGNPSTKTYDYLIDVTLTGPDIRLVIDPEFIVNRP
jgi:hypothetical protein